MSRVNFLAALSVSVACFLGALSAARAQPAGALAPTSPSSPIGERGLTYQGRTVFLVGSGSFWLLGDPYYYNADGSTNLVRLRDHLDKYRPEDASGKALGVIRVGAWATPVRYPGVDHAKKRYPCARVGPGLARDGGLAFDCSQGDDDYFNHVRTVVREAAARGIVIGIILWDEIPFEANTYRWNHNPFCPDNNMNGYGLPACSGDAVPEFYDAGAGALLADQLAMVDRFVAVLRDEPNTFFFVSNEYTGGAAWRDAQIDAIDAANAAHGAALLHVTMDWGAGPSPVSDGVSPSTHSAGSGTVAFRSDGRPVIAQRDYSGSPDRIFSWMRFMDGMASAGTRDDYSGATAPSTTFSTQAAEDQQLRRFVDSLSSDLSLLVPNDVRVEAWWSGRANPGVEYVAWSESSTGSITVDLTGETGVWRLLDWDPMSTALPVDRGTRAGGSSQAWQVRSGECAVRLVREEGLGRPSPPDGVRLE